MQQNEIALYVVKLVLGGIAAFLAILLWSRTRDGAWMSLIAGTIISYAGIVYEILSVFGVIAGAGLSVAGTPLFKLLFAAIPLLFYIAAFVLMLKKSR
jgi:hypothetical protein